MVPLEQVTLINTLLFGHKNLALYDTQVTKMEIINADSDEGKEPKNTTPQPIKVITVDLDDDFTV